MQAVLNISAFLGRVSRRIGMLSGWLLLPLIFVIMLDVVTRKFDVTRLFFSEFTIKFGYSVSTILQDLEWHLHGVILLLGFGYAYLENAHVRVDVFREKISKRAQARNELILLVLFALPFLIVSLNYAFTLFHISLVQWEASDSLTGIGWRWFIKFFMPLGFFVTLLAILATIGRLLVFFFGSDAQKETAESQLTIFTDNHTELGAIREDLEKAMQDTENTPNAGSRDK